MRRGNTTIVLAILMAQAAGAAMAQPLPQARPSPLAQAPAQAQAPVSADPQNTTASFGDWLLRCQRTGEGAQSQRTCEIAQTLQVAGQGPVAQIAIGRVSAGSPMKVTILLPHNMSLPSNVSLGVDDKDPKPLELAWRRCLPAGCLADADFRDDAMKRWRAEAGQGRLKFLDAAGREAVLPFSFRGLAQALDSLAKA